jgi:hypothetical protein
LKIPRAFGLILKGRAPIAALCLFLALPGCERRGKVNRGMLREIHRSCTGKSPCTIRIGDFTPFDWDMAFFFLDGTTEQERSSALGTREEGYREFEDQLVFLKKGRIAYQESEPTDIEKPVKDQIAFATPEDRNFTSFGPNSVFAVSIEEGSDGPWFLLKQVP